MSLPHTEEITGVILCGGEGRRAGGRDKPLIEYRGRPLVEYVLAAMSPCVGTLMVSCNRSEDAYRSYGYPLVGDSRPFNGPMEGIAAALRACETRWLLAAPGDCPGVSVELFRRLVKTPSATHVRVANDGERRQPLFCLLPVVVADRVFAATREGPVAVGRFFDNECEVEDVDCADLADAFVNLNSPG